MPKLELEETVHQLTTVNDVQLHGLRKDTNSIVIRTKDVNKRYEQQILKQYVNKRCAKRCEQQINKKLRTKDVQKDVNKRWEGNMYKKR